MFLSPGNGIQDSLSFSTPRSGFWILGIGFRIPIVSGIPNSLSCILDSKLRIPDFISKVFPDLEIRITLNEADVSLYRSL